VENGYLGWRALGIVASALALYCCYRYCRHLMLSKALETSRIDAVELHGLLTDEPRPVIFDIRSPERRTLDPFVIPGAVFADVPCSGDAFDPWIEDLAARGITGGCGGGNYCASAPVSRAQMAAFLLKTDQGPAYTPPPCTGSVFLDVRCQGGTFDDWIEDLAARGITGGCGGGNYCPDSAVTRAQMAVFLTKTFNLPLP